MIQCEITRALYYCCAVTRILANGGTAFIESWVAIGWNYCDSVRLRSLAGKIFKNIFLEEYFSVLIQNFLKFVSKDLTDNKSRLVQVKVRHWIGTKPLFKSMMTHLTDAYVNGLMQERCNAIALELRLSCTNPLMCHQTSVSWAGKFQTSGGPNWNTWAINDITQGPISGTISPV